MRRRPRRRRWHFLGLRAVHTDTLIKSLVVITLVLAFYGAVSLALTIAGHV